MEADQRLPEILRDTIVWLVQRDDRDLTARQLALLLVCCLDPTPHPVHAVRDKLNLGKAAVSRNTTRLVELDLLKRRDDTRDSRVVLLVATLSGRAFVRALGT